MGSLGFSRSLATLALLRRLARKLLLTHINEKNGYHIMTRIIAVVSQKGGVGKTATTQNLGWELGQMGQRTLLVDFDPQSNLTSGFGLNLTEPRLTVYNAMQEPDKADQCIVNLTEHLDILPANLDLAGAELQLGNQMFAERNSWLRDGLKTLVDQYDFILIDAPPSLGFYTTNALYAANETLIPLQCEYLAFMAMEQLFWIIGEIQKRHAGLKQHRVVLTMRDGRINISKDLEEEARERFAEMIYQTAIPENVSIKEAPVFGQAVGAYKKNSSGAKAYRELAKEVING